MTNPKRWNSQKRNETSSSCQTRLPISKQESRTHNNSKEENKSGEEAIRFLSNPANLRELRVQEQQCCWFDTLDVHISAAREGSCKDWISRSSYFWGEITYSWVTTPTTSGTHRFGENVICGATFNEGSRKHRVIIERLLSLAILSKSWFRALSSQCLQFPTSQLSYLSGS